MTKRGTVLVSLALSIAGCMAVKADFGTVITTPTQLTATQTGNYLVRSGSLYGLPAPTGQGVHIIGNVTVVGPALLQDLVIEGCIVVDRANRVEIQRVWVEHCHGDGIRLISDFDKQQSCCAKLDHVVSINNDGSGLKLEGTADVFIATSEFENNGRYGVELNSSPTTRISQSDFGGNNLGGLYSDDHSGLNLLVNNQYGNNRGDDLTVLGHDNLISNQEFIGPSAGCAIRYQGHQNFGTNMLGPRVLCGE